jgi:hypothetical protein
VRRDVSHNVGRIIKAGAGVFLLGHFGNLAHGALGKLKAAMIELPTAKGFCAPEAIKV